VLEVEVIEMVVEECCFRMERSTNAFYIVVDASKDDITMNGMDC